MLNSNADFKFNRSSCSCQLLVDTLGRPPSFDTFLLGKPPPIPPFPFSLYESVDSRSHSFQNSNQLRIYLDKMFASLDQPQRHHLHHHASRPPLNILTASLSTAASHNSFILITIVTISVLIVLLLLFIFASFVYVYLSKLKLINKQQQHKHKSSLFKTSSFSNHMIESSSLNFSSSFNASSSPASSFDQHGQQTSAQKINTFHHLHRHNHSSTSATQTKKPVTPSSSASSSTSEANQELLLNLNSSNFSCSHG